MKCSIRNPFYPYKRLRKLAAKRIQDRKDTARALRVAGAIFFGIASAIAYHNRQSDVRESRTS